MKATKIPGKSKLTAIRNPCSGINIDREEILAQRMESKLTDVSLGLILKNAMTLLISRNI
jgi:hypothetical protein